uniref:Aminotransferase-like plant mobile domain-containing protein n=1 Tax=Picea sitchensis TaxID=3332 RepID=D5ADH4_PICSI|nr:unknown [Picea sitchensis]
MFKIQEFPINVEDQNQIRIFKNIWRSELHRVAAHPSVLPCADTIAWIIEHVDLQNRYILNTRGEPIASFQGSDLAKYYHLENGTQKLDDELLNKFPYKANDLFKIWCKPDVVFKHRQSRNYPTTGLKAPYQYIVAMLCRLYGKKDASKFTFLPMPLIYYCANEGMKFNWADILSKNLAEAITFVKNMVICCTPCEKAN